MTVGGLKNSTNTTETPVVPYDDSKFSWWRIVVTLVVFCAMAGIILWALKVIGRCQEKKKRGSEGDSLEEESFDSNEKISTSRV